MGNIVVYSDCKLCSINFVYSADTHQWLPPGLGEEPSFYLFLLLTPLLWWDLRMSSFIFWGLGWIICMWPTPGLRFDVEWRCSVTIEFTLGLGPDGVTFPFGSNWNTASSLFDAGESSAFFSFWVAFGVSLNDKFFRSFVAALSDELLQGLISSSQCCTASFSKREPSSTMELRLGVKAHELSEAINRLFSSNLPLQQGLVKIRNEIIARIAPFILKLSIGKWRIWNLLLMSREKRMIYLATRSKEKRLRVTMTNHSEKSGLPFAVPTNVQIKNTTFISLYMFLCGHVNLYLFLFWVIVCVPSFEPICFVAGVALQ